MGADGLGEDGGGVHDPDPGALVVVGGEDEARGGWEVFEAGDEGGGMVEGADGGAEGVDGGRGAVEHVGPEVEDEAPGDGVGDGIRHGLRGSEGGGRMVDFWLESCGSAESRSGGSLKWRLTPFR